MYVPLVAAYNGHPQNEAAPLVVGMVEVGARQEALQEQEPLVVVRRLSAVTQLLLLRRMLL